MKNIWFFLLLLLAGFTACSDDEGGTAAPAIPGAPTEPRGPFQRTVLFYISGENNLSSFIPSELREIREGSKGIGNNACVVYVDDTNPNRNPYILWIVDGVTKDSLTFETDPLSSSPETLTRVLRHTSDYYPAEEYGLILWGHASGWMLEDSLSVDQPSSVAPRRAFGVDNGANSRSNVGKWMNISTLAKTLWKWKHLKFIFADCCQFQCIESAYELRNVTDYIIGSPAEIPGEGAPYDKVVKGLFDPSDSFYRVIADAYSSQTRQSTYYSDTGWEYFPYTSRTPISVITTYRLPDLAKATHAVLDTILSDTELLAPDLLNAKLIYYMGNNSSPKYSVMYDMNDFVRYYTKEIGKETAYDTWKKVFDQTVVYRTNASSGWLTSGQIMSYVFRDGILTDERYGGVSMFVPQNRSGTHYEPYRSNSGSLFEGYNAEIRKTAWYSAAGLSDFGW